MIFSPKTGVDSVGVAQALADIKKSMGKPLLSCWMGDASVGAARSLFNEAAIPSFRTPEAAAHIKGVIEGMGLKYTAP